ncbi:unnamed protein product [Trifolium pratense]|uniref:Uncharacterized protein n=1 Tax=Trifolium pratense TaxID=57577 RepID=A0ACB0LNA7_TRIPR|nr:unnamed protein product [Trifolium pratense]
MNSRYQKENLDRFIPNRSAMDFGYALSMLTEPHRKKVNSSAPITASSEAYRRALADVANLPTRILAFRNKPLNPRNVDVPLSPPRCKPPKPKRHIPKHCEGRFKVPAMRDDFSLNLLDWSKKNVVTLAMDTRVLIWNPSMKTNTSAEIVDDHEEGFFTSVCWSPDGRFITIGLDNSTVQIWDAFSPKPRNKENLDRFIPNRSAMDFGYALSMLTEPHRKMVNSSAPITASSEAYRRALADAANLPTRILAFRNKPPNPTNVDVPLSPPLCKPPKPKRQIPKHCEGRFNVPAMRDDFSLYLLDWSKKNVVTLAMDTRVLIWNPSMKTNTSAEIVDDHEEGFFTSVCWSPDGRFITIGLDNSTVQIWDAFSPKPRKVRVLRDGHSRIVGSLAWNGPILTTGGTNGRTYTQPFGNLFGCVLVV